MANDSLNEVVAQPEKEIIIQQEIDAKIILFFSFINFCLSQKALRDTSLAAPLVAVRRSFSIHQFFPYRKKLVEVRGIEPRSLRNLIKAATCLAPHFKLALATPAGQDLQSAAFYRSRSLPQGY